MKIQELAIVFIIIILPISLVLSIFTQYQIQTINTQTLYDSRLTSATYDAMRAYQLNAANSTTSDLSNSKIRDIEASIETFKNSIVSSFGLDGYTEEDLNSYIPALVYTMYDGFYIYSPYQNVNYQYETEKDPITGEDKVDSEGNPILDETKPTDGNGENQYGLKPYVSYSCRYEKSGIDVVITYSLDNYITVRGTVNGNYINDSGYLIEGVTGNNINGIITYNGIEIKSEQLKEYLPINSVQYPDQMFPYIKLNGTKYYQINDHQIVYISNGNIAVQCDGNQSPEKFSIYKSMIDNNTLAKQYYFDAKEFTERFKDYGLSELSYADARDENGDIIWEGNNTKIFEFGVSTHIEYQSSSFNQHRLAVIRYTIEKNLGIAISNYNNYSGVSNVFQMPELKDYEWDYLTHNISLISFLQGLPIGGKIYNGYTLVTNSESKEVVLEQDIYILGKDNSTNTYNYYRIGDKGLETGGSVNISVGGFASSDISSGRLNLDFNRNTITYQDESYYYYPIKGYRASYNSIVMQNDMTTYDDIYKYVDSQSLELKQAFYTALGRERGSQSVSAEILNTDYITVTMVDQLNNNTRTQIVEMGASYASSGALDEVNKIGWIFKGWYTEENGGGTRVKPEDICSYTEDVTFYAYFEQKEYTLIFDVEGVRELPERTIKINERFDSQGSLPVPSIEGKTFKGWYANTSFSGDQINNLTIFSEELAKNGNQIVLYAKFTNNKYIVQFNANGGNVQPDSKEVEYSKAFGELPIPTRKGYTFDGWYTEENGGVKVTESSQYDISNDSILYAHWIVIPYTVTFNNNIGGTLVGSKTVTYGQPYGTLMNTTRQGYTFLGWYTEPNGGTRIYENSIYNIEGNSTLYAHWIISNWNYGYVGRYETWTAPETGYYNIVLKGASGGISVYSANQTGSYPQLSSSGGRVDMKIYAEAGAVLYVSVGGGGGSGGKFNGDTSASYGGWNGGGAGGIGPARVEQSQLGKYAAGGGGGCTHIASNLNGTDGQLKNYGNANTAQNYVLGVAGGGGASNHGVISYDVNRDSRGGEKGYLSSIFGQGEAGFNFSGYTNTESVPNCIEGTGGGGRRLVWRIFLSRSICNC